MKLLGPPDCFYVSAAIGWLELGNAVEAEAELSQLSEGARELPDVLEVQWQVCAERERWVEGLEVARSLLEVAPERCSGWLHQAYALRRVPEGSVRKAWQALLPAFERFPKESTIPYNLSCYACQMKQFDSALMWLKRAYRVGGKEEVKRLALADSDLQPLWDNIRKM